MYGIAGIEPPLEEVLIDPIIRHLRRYDALPTDAWPELSWEWESPQNESRRAA